MPWNAARGGQAPARVLVACSRDAGLARALQELAAADDVSITLYEDLQGLTGELLRHSSALVLLDAAALDAPVDGVVDAIALQFPDVRLLVAGQGVEQNLLASRIAALTVFRFIHKPVSPQRLKLFLDAAASGTAPWPAPAAAPAGIVARERPRPRSGGLAWIALAAIAATLVTTAWWQWGREPATLQAGAAGGRAVDDLLQRADAALAAGHLVSTEGTSAAELYREALQRAPRSAAAQGGLSRAIEQALRGAEETLLAGDVAAAATATSLIAPLAPDNSRLAFLSAQIERERARLEADASQREALEARRAAIGPALDLMHASLARGELVLPENDSALAHFRSAEAVSAGDAAVRRGREALLAALLTAANGEITAGYPDMARHLVDAAASLNATAPGLDVVRQRLAAASAPAFDAAITPVAMPDATQDFR